MSQTKSEFEEERWKIRLKLAETERKEQFIRLELARRKLLADNDRLRDALWTIVGQIDVHCPGTEDLYGIRKIAVDALMTETFG